MPGGAGPRRKGDAYEREVVGFLRGAGYLATRQPRSAFPDIIAFSAGCKLAVECKLAGRLSREEREALLDLARQHGAVPVLARRRPIELIDLRSNEEVTSWLVRSGSPATSG